MIDATPPFVFLPAARFPFLRPSRGLRAVTRPSALPLLLYVSSGAALFDSPLEYVHAERCRENQVTGRGVARLTREIEIIEQSRRLDDIYSHEFREEVVARLENLHFPIDCRDHRRDSLLPRYSLSRYYSSSSFSLRWISLFILLIIAFFNSSSVLSRRLFGDRDRDNKISSRMRHFFYESRVLLSVFAYSDDILDRIIFHVLCHGVVIESIEFVEKYFQAIFKLFDDGIRGNVEKRCFWGISIYYQRG